jgi:chloramphenicol 3-O-phosphotransferase
MERISSQALDFIKCLKSLAIAGDCTNWLRYFRFAAVAVWCILETGIRRQQDRHKRDGRNRGDCVNVIIAAS